MQQSLYKGKEKFLLVSILPHTTSDLDVFNDMKELKSLVDAYGGEVIDFLIQRREVHDKGSYLGAGKMSEIKEMIKQEHIDVVVLNAVVKPGQIYDMQTLFYTSNKQIKVWDRVDLILEIFAKHAHTAEARLQIELAAMRHMGPRIYGMGHVLSRQGGSIGTRGIGETNTELMKRHWRTQMKKTQDKLKKLAEDRQRQLERRERVGLKTVSIIGYTNAGKTSLFNKLTGKDKLVQNALFATLDSNVGELYLPDLRRDVLLSDTIGFIRDLPTTLIDAFKSTLLESIHADLLLQVIDVSDPDFERKIAAVGDILTELHIGQKKQLFVCNKIDCIDSAQKQYVSEKYKEYDPQFISVKDEIGLNELIQRIEQEVELPLISPVTVSDYL